MDEQALEKMITRSFVSIRQKETILLTSAVLFIASLFWLCCRAVLGHFVNSLYTPFLILSFSVALLPLAPLISPLALFVLSYRKQDAHLSIVEACTATWRPSLALFIQGIILLALEIVLATISVLWSFFEVVPVLGQIIHLFSSWIPPIITFLMLIALLFHAVLALFLGTVLVVHPVHATKANWNDLAIAFSNNWLLRLKLYIVGALPILFLLTFFTGWEFISQISYTEFCASVFRLIIFSLLYAPFFIFLVHMVVEAERYIVWRARNKAAS